MAPSLRLNTIIGIQGRYGYCESTVKTRVLVFRRNTENFQQLVMMMDFSSKPFYIVSSCNVWNAHALHWRHNDHDDAWNHQPHGCLLNRLFRRRSKKTSKLRVTGLCVGNSPGPVNSPHKGPVTRKMFPFDDIIMEKDNIVPTDAMAISTVSKPSLMTLTFKQVGVLWGLFYFGFTYYLLTRISRRDTYSHT